jgi:hypothetical protein
MSDFASAFEAHLTWLGAKNVKVNTYVHQGFGTEMRVTFTHVGRTTTIIRQLSTDEEECVRVIREVHAAVEGILLTPP